MLDRAKEGLLYGLAKLLANKNAGQSEEMAAALTDADAYQEYRAACVKTISDAATKYCVQIKGKDVLDLGCYDGAVTTSLNQLQPKSLSGVDIDEAAVEIAQKKAATNSIRFLASSKNKLPLETESIDTILSYDVFEHIEHPAQSLAECYRILRPGGKLLIGTWGWHHPFAPHLWSVMPVPWAHVVFSEKTMLRTCRRIYQSDWYQPNMHDYDKDGQRIPEKFCSETIPTDYLNKYLIRDFKRVFAESNFDFKIHSERFSSKYAFWTPPLLHIPVIKEFFTSYIWCVLQKPATSTTSAQDNAKSKVTDESPGEVQKKDAAGLNSVCEPSGV